MSRRTGPSRWSIDFDEQASQVEVLGGGALVTAALMLAAVGIFRVLHRHPSDVWQFGALALAGAGLLVLVVSFTFGARARAGGPRWAASADAATPGVLLFLLEPTHAMPEPATAATRLGPVRCQVTYAGEAAVTAPDDRISRVRGVLMTRYHPSFFAGVQHPSSGSYAFRWEERDGEDWRVLVAGSAEVVVREPAAGDPDWGLELAQRVGWSAVAPAAEGTAGPPTGPAAG